MPLQKPTAIIFDWDGTLVDTLPGLRLAHNHARVQMGFPEWTEQEFFANLKHSARELYPRLYGDDSARAMEILYDYVEKNHIQHLHVMPDALSLLNFLHDARIPIGIVSNKNQKYLEREIAHLGLTQHFFCIFGAGVATRDKPAGDPITLALTKAAPPLQASQIWFIGDTVTDLLASQAAGCPAILLTHGQDKTELISLYKPLFVAANCGELLAKIRSLI